MVRAALARLFVALVALVTAIVALAAGLVRLAAAGVGALTTRLAAGRSRPRPAAPARGPLPANVRRLSDARRPSEGPRNRRVLGAPGSAAARLESALTGLGFAAPAVRAFVGSLGDRAEREPIEGLIKEGLRALAA
jgi:hypothetical protein